MLFRSVIQRDAFERLGLKAMLMEPEFLATLTADVHLVADLMSLRGAIPAKAKDTARQVVRKVVDELERKLATPLIQAVRGSLNRAARTSRPRQGEIDWDRTIRANLKNFLPERQTIIAEDALPGTEPPDCPADMPADNVHGELPKTSTVIDWLHEATLPPSSDV